MAKEPRSGKKPDDEQPKEPVRSADDILSDSSLEELDLESLLADEKAEPATGTEGKNVRGMDPGEDAILDDGEIDLLSDDAVSSGSAHAAGSSGSVEEVTTDDLLSMDGLEEDTKTLASEGATNGQTPSDEEPAGDVLEPASRITSPGRPEEEAGEAKEIDLLSDDAILDVPEAAVEPEEKGAVLAAGGKSSRADDGEETAVLPERSGGKKGDKQKARRASKKLGKVRSEPEPGSLNAAAEGEAAARGEEMAEEPAARGSKAGKKDRGKMPGKAGKEAAEKEKLRPAAAVTSRGSVAFVCSECYEEFLLPANYSQEMVSCPECLHVGKRPDEDFLRTVNRHKAGERKSLAMAIAAGAILLTLVLALLWLTSDMYIAQHKGQPDKNVVLGLLGGSALATLIFAWLTVRFEGNRWEVYF